MKKLLNLLLSSFISLSCSAKEQKLPRFKPGKQQKQEASSPANLKVAFLGDSDDGDHFREVLTLIKKQKAELTVHMGDLSYSILSKGPRKWDEAVTEVLGAKYPYLATIGNHDLSHWHTGSSGYVTLFNKRISGVKDLSCFVHSADSDFGVKSFCRYKGLLVILSGVGTRGYYHESFVSKVLADHKQQPWKICTWHKNQRDMQVGSKENETGWGVYKACNEHGALVATGHEHSYARSRTLTDMGNRSNNYGAIGEPDSVELGYKKNFVFVNGLGGKSIRSYDSRFGSPPPKWWASLYTSDFWVKNRDIRNKEWMKNKEFGVLFITFNYNGDPKKAKAQFITASGTVRDEFIISQDK